MIFSAILFTSFFVFIKLTKKRIRKKNLGGKRNNFFANLKGNNNSKQFNMVIILFLCLNPRANSFHLSILKMRSDIHSKYIFHWKNSFWKSNDSIDDIDEWFYCIDYLHNLFIINWFYTLAIYLKSREENYAL